MNFFQICQDQCVYDSVTPRNSHIQKRYKCPQTKKPKHPLENHKKSLSNKGIKTGIHQSGTLQSSKKSLRKNHLKEPYSSLKSTQLAFQQSSHSLQRLEPQTPTRKNMKQVPKYNEHKQKMQYKNYMHQLESFYSYGMLGNEINQPMRIDSGKKKPAIKFIYQHPEDRRQVNEEEKNSRHQRNFTQATLMTSQTCMTKNQEQNTKIEDSKITNIRQISPKSNFNRFGKNIHSDANSIKSSQSNQFDNYLLSKQSLSRSALHIDQLSCIRAESVMDDNQSLNYSDQFSQVMVDSYITKLKKCQSAEYFGYTSDLKKSGLSKQSRIYIN